MPGSPGPAMSKVQESPDGTFRVPKDSPANGTSATVFWLMSDS